LLAHKPDEAFARLSDRTGDNDRGTGRLVERTRSWTQMARESRRSFTRR
jgi:hypothetical protein